MMTKKFILITISICLLLTLLTPVSVLAQSKLRVLDNSTQIEYPLRLHFNLSVVSQDDVIDIRLHYMVDRESFARVVSEVYIEFEPAVTVDINWIMDMRKTGGLPPGAIVKYWWSVEDAAGNKVETVPGIIEFKDNHYSWRNLNENKITLYWYHGQRTFASELMEAARQALARLAEDTGA